MGCAQLPHNESGHSHAGVGCAEQLIRITTEERGDDIDFFVENLQTADITITLEVNCENLASSVPLPCTETYAGKTRTKVFTLAAKDKDKPWRWNYTYYATYGSIHSVHNDQYTYALPYASGQSFRVSQGYDGEFSHFGANQYAIDWKMPQGTPVHAARGGIVVGAKDDSNMGGPENQFDTKANFILIQHSDGTLGHYVHLKQGGNRVKVGDRVRVGDLIGLSGNTGFTTGPHLHFSVFKARNGKDRMTIPVKFRVTEGVLPVLQAGQSYRAVPHPEELLAVESDTTTAVGAPTARIQ